MSERIDFVIPWVDGGDPAWREEKSKFTVGRDTDDRDERYRDWDNLKYWFRGVEKYAPWCGKIHFITWGHLPKWLNKNNEKLHIVNHRDYIPEKYLPTYNCNVLEINMHKIEGLSDRFIYFNDDMFIIDKMREKDFFKGDRPCDMLALQPVVANPMSPMMSYIYQNNSMVLSKYFNKRENMKKYPGNYWKIGYPLKYFGYNFMELAFPLFTGFYTVHGPSAFLKKTFEQIWEREEEILNETSSHKFRDRGDVSQYLFREWQKLSGDFIPKNISKNFKYFNVDNDNYKLINTIEKQSARCICINDANVPIDFERAKSDINRAFDSILSEKSSFEL